MGDLIPARPDPRLRLDLGAFDVKPGERVRTLLGPFGRGTIRYVEHGCAVVKWDDLPKIYSYDMRDLYFAPTEGGKP